MKMSQHPNIGPLYGLLAIANWGKFNLYFYFNYNENMNVFCYLSGLQFFLELFHVNGVYPPNIFPY